MNTELIYFIGGIFLIYGISISIMCYRAIKSVSNELKNRIRSEHAEDARQQERLLAEAYRILNNHEHKA
jgi:hypothetical protein